jgi:hypothetical protein
MKFTKGTRLRMLGTSAKVAWKEVDGKSVLTIPAGQRTSSEHVWVVKVVAP